MSHIDPDFKCMHCGGDGFILSGHYDTFSSSCRYCEGTGKQKWKRCANCRSKKFCPDCPVCNGTKGVGIFHFCEKEPSYYVCKEEDRENDEHWKLCLNYEDSIRQAKYFCLHNVCTILVIRRIEEKDAHINTIEYVQTTKIKYHNKGLG